MENMVIKQYTFCTCPGTADFCHEITDIGWLEETKERDWWYRGRMGAVVDLVVYDESRNRFYCLL
jgi:hypothetical protein